jgi:uncharacterized protein with von Willebrand factor type A (vWA) domain
VFAFIDTTDEVTGLFGPDSDLAVAVQRIAREAASTPATGSDMATRSSHSWRVAERPVAAQFVAGPRRQPEQHRNPETDLLAHMVNASRHAHWLNPSPGTWGSATRRCRATRTSSHA